MAFKQRGVQGQIAATATAVLTAGSNVTIQPTKLILYGEEADTNTIIYIVRSGNSADATTKFETITSIALNERVDISFAGVVLYDGDAIHLQSATANRINYDLSYNERTGE
jgi:hypothetical protein